MTDLLAAAVADNVQWCERVCAVHGLSSRVEAGVWSTTAPAPPLYPDSITTEAAATSARVNDGLRGRRPAWVKDSYARLALGGYGFAPLFSGTWIGLDGRAGTRAAPTPWEAATTESALTQWSAARGGGDVFRPALLADPAVLFLARRYGDATTAGAIVTRGETAVGLSNLFSRTVTEDVWPSIVAELRVRYPGAPIVGYERDDDLIAARTAGFTALGPLRVWARPGGDA